MVVVARMAVAIELSEAEERELRSVLRTPSASQQQALRARIVLRAAEGATNTQIAAEAGVSLPTVGLWRRNFSERGLDGLADAPRSGLRDRSTMTRFRSGCASWCPEPREPRPDLRPVPRRESRQYEYLLRQI